MRLSVAATATAALLILVAGCAVPPKAQEPTGNASGAVGAAGVPEGFETYYSQKVAWSSCENSVSRFECATVTAPMDWADPGSEAIDLNVKRQVASGERTGALFTNPGGPGGSGTKSLEYLAGSFSSAVTETYDIVSWDPRGVQDSAAVTCFDDVRKDESLSKDVVEDDAGLAALRTEYAAWASACKENTGELLGYVDTQSSARDLDMLRAVMNEEYLTYVGFSYGTHLGATYAGLFPANAGRLILDGAIDITLSTDESTEQQAVGFEEALRSYVKDCQGGASCPITGDVDAGVGQIATFLAGLFAKPMDTGDPDRPLTESLGFTGIAVALYDDEAWPILTDALSEAIKQKKGSQLLRLADIYNDRQPGGSFDGNQAEAFRAVNCLDDRADADPAAMAAQRERLKAEAPTVGKYFSYGGLVCADWPYPVAEKNFDISAPGAAPIIVIGTTGDPATPYKEAVELAKTLESGVMVTFEGEGHTAIGRSNACITDAVDAFLLTGSVPQDGLTC